MPRVWPLHFVMLQLGKDVQRRDIRLRCMPDSVAFSLAGNLAEMAALGDIHFRKRVALSLGYFIAESKHVFMTSGQLQHCPVIYTGLVQGVGDFIQLKAYEKDRKALQPSVFEY